MKITPTELADLVNEKTLLTLGRAIISKIELTPNKKISVIYSNTTIENYGCFTDCLETLNAKFNLKLDNSHLLKFQSNVPKRIKQDSTLLFKRNTNSHIISVIKSTLDKVQKSKKNVYLNMSEIKKTISSLKGKILLSDQEALNMSISNLYKRSYFADKDMLIYIDAIRKEINSF
ncbi:hypothetical protein KKA17_08355 [bacterium]|nr:hypothetical protein [bacterium]